MRDLEDFNHQMPIELAGDCDSHLDPLSKLYKQFSMFHESVEDFIERMEFDNGRDWLSKFIS